MKIIGKIKDYYDYLAGTWGIDEKLILDRTKFTPLQDIRVYEDSIVRFFIAGYMVEGLFRNGKFYYGKEIEQFSAEVDDFYWKWTKGRTKESHYVVEHLTHRTWGSNFMDILKAPVKAKVDLNTLLGCPILIQNQGGELTYGDHSYSRFPILKDFNMVDVFTPEQVWQMLYDFLSKTKDIPNTQTDKDKIIGHGFDYKHSFRNTK